MVKFNRHVCERTDRLRLWSFEQFVGVKCTTPVPSPNPGWGLEMSSTAQRRQTTEVMSAPEFSSQVATQLCPPISSVYIKYIYLALCTIEKV